MTTLTVEDGVKHALAVVILTEQCVAAPDAPLRKVLPRQPSLSPINCVGTSKHKPYEYGKAKVTETEIQNVEASIATLVREFYGTARLDPLLGPVFNRQVEDWDTHLRVVGNFWSKVLLKTDRYSGHAYVHHVNLPIEPQHIDHWLELFTETVHATLPAQYAEAALAKARMMGESFKAGMFPFVDKDGRPSRHPA